MLVKTPKMYVRPILPSGYEQYLLCGYTTMRGSGANLQSDFASALWTPGSFTRNADRTIDCSDAAAVALTSGAHAVLPANADGLVMGVGRIRAAAATINVAIGSANIATSTGGMVARYTATLGAFFGTSVGAAYGSATLLSAAALPVGSKVLLVSVCDRSDASAGLKTYLYNLDTNTVIDDEETSHAVVAGNAITPESVVRIDGFDKFYGSLAFGFTANALPSTWKTDVVTIAENLLTLKGG